MSVQKCINCRISSEQHSIIKRAATSYGMTITDFVIKCCMVVSESRTAQLNDLEVDLKGFVNKKKKGDE